MSRNSFLVAMFFASFAYCGAAPSFGEIFFKENRAENLYGKGVHVFFDKNYNGAIDVLKQVDQLDSADPRPYYFLALSYYRLHKNNEADEYFKKAARLEQEGRLARDYNVSDALRRIQGRERLHVEKYRTQAKADRLNSEKQKDSILYSNGKVEENRILRAMSQQPVVVAPFGAKSIDPLGTGKKIDAPIEVSKTPADVNSKPKEEGKKAVLPDTKKSNKKEEDEEEEDAFASSDNKKVKADDTKESVEEDDDKDMKADDNEKADEKSDKEKDDENPFAGSDDKEMKTDGAKKSDEKSDEQKDDDDDPFK